VTLTIFGTTVGYPSDSLASCFFAQQSCLSAGAWSSWHPTQCVCRVPGSYKSWRVTSGLGGRQQGAEVNPATVTAVSTVGRQAGPVAVDYCGTVSAVLTGQYCYTRLNGKLSYCY